MDNTILLTEINKQIKDAKMILRITKPRKELRYYIEGKLTAYESIKKLLIKEK